MQWLGIQHGGLCPLCCLLGCYSYLHGPSIYPSNYLQFILAVFLLAHQLMSIVMSLADPFVLVVISFGCSISSTSSYLGPSVYFPYSHYHISLLIFTSYTTFILLGPSVSN